MSSVGRERKMRVAPCRQVEVTDVAGLTEKRSEGLEIDVDSALYQTNHALHAFVGDPEPRGQLRPRRDEQGLARALDLTQGRRAVHAVHGAELIDRQLQCEVLLEKVALAHRERGRRSAERIAELGAVEPFQVLDLGI